MKNTTRFANLSVVVCILYLAFCVVCFFVEVSSICGNIFATLYETLLVAFPLVLMAESKCLRRPAVYILVSSLLKLVNTWLTAYVITVPKEDLTTAVSVVGGVYLLYLVFMCLGFFKLSKLLPKSSLLRGLSIAYPCSYFLQMALNMTLGFFNLAYYQGLCGGIGCLQIAIIALLIYSLFKGIERKQI